MKIRKAVLPVGGWATRFLPITKAVPKALRPILDRPIIQYVVEEAIAAGIQEFVFVVTRNNQAIVDYFSPSSELEGLLEKKGKSAQLEQVRALSAMASFSPTPAKAWRGLEGLGAAILNARHFVGDEPFAVLLPNDLIHSPASCLSSLVHIHQSFDCTIIAAHAVADEEISTYGNIAVTEMNAEVCLNTRSYNPKRIHQVRKLVQRPT